MSKTITHDFIYIVILSRTLNITCIIQNCIRIGSEPKCKCRQMNRNMFVKGIYYRIQPKESFFNHFRIISQFLRV
uniref:SJCHGC09797 protein n=1 Tax=Schistosoma japonicum TaxID=6182 RepID=Q5BQV2_SCHJA|nr:SJCHGC09797 protein [Schistosoma japonicum]